MANFKSRLVLSGAALFILIVFLSSSRTLRPTPVPLHLSRPPADSAIDHIPRDGGLLPRYWTTADMHAPGDSDIDDLPTNVNKVMGLVFYGRREIASILDCYLKRNLAKNGGLLDGVIFVERTTDPEDLAFLDHLLDSEPDYQRWKIRRPNQTRRKGDYSAAYEKIEDETMYIKIDDDIVFIEDSVIPSLVHTKAARPDIYVVSANVVNQPMMSWVHWNLGAVRPYMPEISGTFRHFWHDEFNWRPSTLPDWKGDENFNVTAFIPPSEQQHRWLPLRGEQGQLLNNITPIASTEYDPYGPGWRRWQIAAQEHYSFLETLESNDLWRYKFNMWDFQTNRMGIQFVAMNGRDINLAKPIEKDDEWHFGVTMPRKLGRLAVADGRGVAAHYSFRTQLKTEDAPDGSGGINATDVLDRYRSFAMENICAQPPLWISREDDERLNLAAGPRKPKEPERKVNRKKPAKQVEKEEKEKAEKEKAEKEKDEKEKDEKEKDEKEKDNKEKDNKGKDDKGKDKDNGGK